MIHQFKILPEYFEAVVEGKKTFEIRINDRGFKEGDFLALNEFAEGGYYTGRSCVVFVDYILGDTKELLLDGVVCMAIKPCGIYKVQEGIKEVCCTPPNWNSAPVIEREETEGRS